MSSVEAHFNVHPSVVFKLGEDLITDDVQAVAELVKNSYDADASRVIVRIHTRESPDEYPDDRGYIVVTDDGFGMSSKTLVAGWLTISDSSKRDMKAAGRTTDKGRTPMGDKGLGRLGAQRLGNRLSIETSQPDSSVVHRLSFDWRSFVGKRTLEEVPIQIVTTRERRKPGTRLLISDLHDPELLGDRDRLHKELAKIISPYEAVQGFQLLVTVDGERLDLSAANSRVRDAAVIRYTLNFDGNQLRMRGEIRLAHLRPNSKADRATWHEAAERDRGASLLRYLQDQPEASTFQLQKSRSNTWWASFSHSINISDIKPRMIDGRVATPGPFTGQIDAFNLSEASVEDVGVFNRAKEIRALMKEMHGIRVYRDGFNVRIAEDWLGLGRQITSGGSWYGLRPGTTMGYIAISSQANAQLVETTDREGFTKTPAYENFLKLLGEFIKTSAGAQEFIGRGAAAYRKLYDLDDDPEETSEEVLDSLTGLLGEAKSYLGPLESLRSQLEVQADQAGRLIRNIDIEEHGGPHEAEILAQISRLSSQATAASELVTRVEQFITELSDRQGAAKRLSAEMDRISEQLTLTYETMAVGLTAEALSHEIGNIAERLARRSTEMLRYVKQKHPVSTRMIEYIQHVQGTVAGLRRQLAHLAPSLRYVRERRERIAMSSFVKDIAEYYEARWNGKVSFVFEIVDDFMAVMNRGKLLQVFDNLILNSEYWLLEDVRLGHLSEPVVTVIVEAPVVYISDNGRGVDRQVEDALFEAFISKKPQGAGRGLGLFIVRQLLDAEGCEIELTSARNSNSRRYMFSIDLASVATDE